MNSNNEKVKNVLQPSERARLEAAKSSPSVGRNRGLPSYRGRELDELDESTLEQVDSNNETPFRKAIKKGLK